MSYLNSCVVFMFVCVGRVQHVLWCVYLRIVYPILSVSQDCPFLIVPSVLSNVYSQTTTSEG